MAACLVYCRSWYCGSMSCVLWELVLWQHVLCIVWVGAVAACLVYCELVFWQHVLCIVWVGAVAACVVYCVSWCCGSMCCVLCELVLWQHVLCIVWVVYCSQWAWLWMCVRHAATAPTERNDVNHGMFLNYNFNKEQCMLPQDDRMIETWRNVLGVSMWILDY